MNPKRTYFPPTTPQQRKLLFETWQATGSVVAGYPDLENYAAKGPAKGYGQTPTAVAQKVIELHAAHRDWGKQRLAHDAKRPKGTTGWRRFSPNTVRRILTDAGAWQPKPPRTSKALRPVVRTADKPGQAVNVDL